MAHLDPTLYAVATGEHLDGVPHYATAGQRLDVDSFDLHEELDPLEELEVRVAGEEEGDVYTLQLFEYGEPPKARSITSMRPCTPSSRAHALYAPSSPT